LTKEQQEILDKVLATLPLPPNVTIDPSRPEGVTNVQVLQVPC